MIEYSVSDKEVAGYRQRIEQLIKKSGYFLNPDNSFTDELLRGVLINLKRYGYEACPCRLAQKDRLMDIDIWCPCYYRDDDVSEYGACYCGLYVSREAHNKNLPVKMIPERRPSGKNMSAAEQKTVIESKPSIQPVSHDIYRCQVCGYIAARDTAPDVCPICGAPKERFELFIAKK